MSFWVEPATPALTGVKPAGLDGGAVLSGMVSVPTAAVTFGGRQAGGAQAVRATVPVMLPLVAPAWPPPAATCRAIEKSCWIGRPAATVPATEGMTVKVSE